VGTDDRVVDDRERSIFLSEVAWEKTFFLSDKIRGGIIENLFQLANVSVRCNRRRNLLCNLSR
jgi:hypothetical protein